MQNQAPVPAKLAVSRRQRSTPYTPRVEALGVSDYSIVNHTILPKGFGRSVEEDYWHLKEHVQLWDVSCQRQVQLQGADAARLVQLMTPRDLRDAVVGQCFYAPIVDQHAKMINDPIILKLANDRFWLSIADSDVLLWAKGLAVGYGLNVDIVEPDVSPLAVQGPKSDDVMAELCGESIRDLGFFKFVTVDFRGQPTIVARSGYSKQGGFEIYLSDSNLGLDLWDAVWNAGQAFDMRPGCPNLIERIEGGLLSYGNEFTSENNPLECGMDKYCSDDSSLDFIGKDALEKIRLEGVSRAIRGVLFDGDKTPACASTWALSVDGQSAGHISSAIWSPRFNRNIALGMLEKEFWSAGQRVLVACSDGSVRTGSVTQLPFESV